GGGFLVEAVFAQAEATTVEVGFDRVGGGGVLVNGLAVGVEQLAAFAALLVGHPDAGGIASQVDQRDAGERFSRLPILRASWGVWPTKNAAVKVSGWQSKPIIFPLEGGGGAK
ncbi:hypothetical protein EBU02_12810, partial [bacterium]|nr:hypothetical protein [bacterium]